MNQDITFHRILDILENFQKNSPMLNTFAYGNLIDFGQQHISGGTVNYPFLFAVPQSIEYQENTTIYQFNLLFADILNVSLDNEKDIISNMSLEVRRFLSFVKYGINTYPELFNNIDVTLPTIGYPFWERFSDHVGGIALDCNITVFEPLDACIWFPTPTASPDPTSTPTQTPSQTPTPTCSLTTQYMEVELQDNTKFKLVLWNNNDFTSPATAPCDLPVSGTAYGDLGTIYTGVEAIDFAQHQHQFDLAGVLLPGEVVTGFTVHNVNTLGCTCPVEIIYCGEYSVSVSGIGVPANIQYIDCDGNAQSTTINPGDIQVVSCARLNSFTYTGGPATITYLNPCS